MIEERANREAELANLMHSDRAGLVAIYNQATGRHGANKHPDVLTCAQMIREIVEIEFPFGGGVYYSA